MKRYYQNELDNLRKIAKEFAENNPTLAPQLAEASADPDAERILEGVAFLTAGIRQKIDDEFPEFSQGLLNQIFPHYLRPIPSATIIEFKAAPILKNTLTMKAGTYLDSIEIDGVQCRYKTTCDVDVAPIEISEVRGSETSTGRRAIDLTLTADMDLSAWGIRNLRLHIADDYQGAVDTFYILNQFVDATALIDAQGNEIVAPGLSIEAAGFDEDFRLLEYPSNSFPAYRLIQEYLLLKQKFLFVDVQNLGSYLPQLGGNRFTLRFYLKELPMQLPRLTNSRFVLHATPAINLFSHEAESFVNDYRHSYYEVQPMRNADHSYEIYSIDQVNGNNRKLGRKSAYTQMGLFDPDNNTQPVYQTTTRAGEAGRINTYISFSYPPSYELDNRESIQISLTCSNGRNTEKLKAGDITRKTSSTSELVDFSNIIAPSDSQPAPTGQSVLWRLLSHLAINYLSLADADNLKSLLELYLFPARGTSREEAANRKRIDSITEIRVQPCDRLVDGIPMRGQAIQVTAEARQFSSNGDLYLFGMMLDRLLASFASLNCFTEFSLVDSSSNQVYRWPIRAGDRLLI